MEMKTERRAVSLIAEREKLLSQCINCNNEVSNELLSKLKIISEKVLKSIRVWQQVHKVDTDANFAWNKYPSYISKMRHDTNFLLDKFSLKKELFYSKQNSKAERDSKLLRKWPHNKYQPLDKIPCINSDPRITNEINSSQKLHFKVVQLELLASVQRKQLEKQQIQRRQHLWQELSRKIVFIQRQYRRNFNRNRRSHAQRQFITLQAIARGRSVRRRNVRNLKARKYITAVRERRQLEQNKSSDAITRIQTVWRRYSCSRNIKFKLERHKLDQMACFVTRFLRFYSIKTRVYSKVVQIQAVIRTWMVKRSMAALLIQTRMFLIIVSRVRVRTLRVFYHTSLVHDVESALLKIKWPCNSLLHKRISAAQILGRFAARILTFRHNGMSRIQALWRMNHLKTRYESMKTNIIQIQKHWRSYSQRNSFLLLVSKSRIERSILARNIRRRKASKLITAGIRAIAAKRNHASKTITNCLRQHRFKLRLQSLYIQSQARLVTMFIRTVGKRKSAAKNSASTTITKFVQYIVLTRNHASRVVMRAVKQYIAFRHVKAVYIQRCFFLYKSRRNKASRNITQAVRTYIKVRQRSSCRISKFIRYSAMKRTHSKVALLQAVMRGKFARRQVKNRRFQFKLELGFTDKDVGQCKQIRKSRIREISNVSTPRSVSEYSKRAFLARKKYT